MLHHVFPDGLPLPDKIVYMYSVQHTGTWFVLWFLDNHPDILGHITANDLMLKNPGLFDGPFIARSKKKIVFHSHINAQMGPNGLFKVPTDEQYKKFLGVYHKKPEKRRYLIPIRDPLLSLITRHTRHPKRDHIDVIRGFEMLATTFSKNGFFLPVDLDLTSDRREVLLRGALEYVDLDPKPYIKTIAKEWPIRGSEKGGEKLKKLYKNREMRYLERKLSECRLLKKKESAIRPFLENLGYENLLWWS